MNELIEKIIRDVELDAKELYDFLVSCNVQPSSKKLEELIRQLDNIVAIRNGKEYIGVETVDGIVVGYSNIDGIIPRQTLPEDVLRGYYRYDNGKITLDEKLRQKIWG